MFNQDHLTEIGFVGFERLHSLPRGCRHVPECPGIYVVLIDRAAPHAFLERSVGGHFKGQDGSVAISALLAKWSDDEDTLYIGRTNSLSRRLDEFARYGRGEPVGHRGGRYLWQLAEHDRLLVAWRPERDPAAAESDLLDEFEARFGHLPFANLVRGRRARALA
jgi:hypothetical protein